MREKDAMIIDDKLTYGKVKIIRNRSQSVGGIYTFHRIKPNEILEKKVKLK